jgi:cysteine desulfurase / selenocysteine lyase
MFLGNSFMKAVKEMSNWDVEKIRADFPVLAQTVNGKPLRYLDKAASSQVPQVVIDRGAKSPGRTFKHSSRRALFVAARDDSL